MVYFRMIPLGLAGGSQDTTTLLAEDGTALIPAGGPGTEEGEHGRAGARRAPRSLPSWEMRQRPAVGLASQAHPGKQLKRWCHRQAGTVLPAGHLSMGGSGPHVSQRQEG